MSRHARYVHDSTRVGNILIMILMSERPLLVMFAGGQKCSDNTKNAYKFFSWYLVKVLVHNVIL